MDKELGDMKNLSKHWMQYGKSVKPHKDILQIQDRRLNSTRLSRLERVVISLSLKSSYYLYHIISL